jgi:DDE superfamily endonuclease
VLENALYFWFRKQEGRDLPVTDELLTAQAKIFGADPTINACCVCLLKLKGLARRFQEAPQHPSFTKHGEAGDANTEDSYNHDESGLFFWRHLPTSSHATGKKDKQRVTVASVCNANGTDKHALFLIGKSKRPRSFPKTFQTIRDLNVRYATNKIAWMTSAEFSEWILDWNSGCLCAVAVLYHWLQCIATAFHLGTVTVLRDRTTIWSFTTTWGMFAGEAARS